MKLSITPISLARAFREGPMDLDRFIDWAAELKLDAVDLLDSRCYAWLWRDFAAQSKALPSKIASAGLRLAAYGCGNNFAQPDDAALDEQVRIVHRAIDEAAQLGAPALRIFGGYHEQTGGKSGITYANGFAAVLRGIERCLPEAEKRGVVLALENHGRLPGHGYEIAAILDHFDSPWLRCMFDCANFQGNNMDEPEDPLHALSLLRGRIVHAHVKDFGPAVARKDRRIEAYVAGEGTVPLRQILGELERDGYEGYCSLEYEAGFKMPELEGVQRSFEYLKQVREMLEVLFPAKVAEKAE
jgi:sugar phosphate isomerase/epimerase